MLRAVIPFDDVIFAHIELTTVHIKLLNMQTLTLERNYQIGLAQAIAWDVVAVEGDAMRLEQRLHLVRVEHDVAAARRRCQVSHRRDRPRCSRCALSSPPPLRRRTE